MPSVVATLQALVLEQQATIVDLRAAIVRLEERARDLEIRVGQHSGNSSRPPSSDLPGTPKRPPSRPSGRGRGGQPRSRRPPAGHGATRTGRRGDRSLSPVLLGVQDRAASGTGFARSGGNAGLRGASGDRATGDPSSHHRAPPCVPVVWDPNPGILAHRVPHRIVRSPGAGNRRHAWWTVPPEAPGNLRGHGAGVRGADQHRQRRRPLPGNRGRPRPGDRRAGSDPPDGTPAPCGRDAPAPWWGTTWWLWMVRNARATVSVPSPSRGGLILEQTMCPN